MLFMKLGYFVIQKRRELLRTRIDHTGQFLDSRLFSLETFTFTRGRGCLEGAIHKRTDLNINFKRFN